MMRIGILGATSQIARDLIVSFWIGVYPGLDEKMLDYVVGKMETFFGVNC